MRPGRFEYFLAILLAWWLAVIIGAAPRRRENRRRLSEMGSTSSRGDSTTTLPPTTLSSPPTCDQACCIDLGLVKNCSENENEKAQEKIDTEKEEVVSEGGEGFDNATITPQSSRLVDIEDKTWLLNSTVVEPETNSTESEAQEDLPKNVHLWEAGGWKRYEMKDFLDSYCPKTRKARSLHHFGPVTCDGNVICTPRFERRSECVAHTGVNCHYPCGGPAYKDCFIVPTPPDEHGRCLVYDCAYPHPSPSGGPAAMTATVVGATLGIVLIVTMAIFLVMKKCRIGIRRNGFYRLPAFNDEDVEAEGQNSSELERICGNADYIGNVTEEDRSGERIVVAAVVHNNPDPDPPNPNPAEPPNPNPPTPDPLNAVNPNPNPNHADPPNPNPTDALNQNPPISDPLNAVNPNPNPADPNPDANATGIANENAPLFNEDQGNQHEGFLSQLRYEDIMERTSLATIYEADDETDATNEELEWDHSYGYRLVDIEPLIDSD